MATSALIAVCSAGSTSGANRVCARDAMLPNRTTPRMLTCRRIGHAPARGRRLAARRL